MAESIIIANSLKGSPATTEVWLEKMRKIYPGFMDEDWAAFEDMLAMDSVSRARVTNDILLSVKARGYDARIVDLGDGFSTVEIAE